ncbi:MAG: carbohydrate kinase family protein [Propionicimonas sp.]|uniref:carbohydrate kinase family protein n=1 Tax=Propionicimonas sp. TaxID=1955623 RepID=UPI003D0A6CDC
MSARVLVAGDANLDLVLRGDVRPRFGQAEQFLTGADLVLGSSAGICASGLARLDADVALVARVGDDVFGDRTRALLDAAGVDTGLLRTVPGATGLSVILSEGGDRSILTLPGAMATLSASDVRAAVGQGRATHLHVAAYFLVPGFAEWLPEVLAEAKASGLTTSLDPNWDPRQSWTGVAECLPYVDVLLPNAAEAVALAGDAAASDAVAAARLLAARGPLVVVKDGAAGGFAVVGDDVVRAPGLVVDVVDTTGAGDSFDAGFLVAWLEGREQADCLAWAAVAGSLSTTGTGGTGRQADRAALLAALGRS